MAEREERREESCWLLVVDAAVAADDDDDSAVVCVCLCGALEPVCVYVCRIRENVSSSLEKAGN